MKQEANISSSIIKPIDDFLLFMLEQLKLEFNHHNEFRPLLQWCASDVLNNAYPEYKPTAIRAFYYSYLCSYNIDSIVEFTQRRRLVSNFESACVFSQVLGLDNRLVLNLQTYARLNRNLTIICEQVLENDPILTQIRLCSFETQKPQLLLRVLLPQFLQLEKSNQFQALVAKLSTDNTTDYCDGYNPPACTQWWRQSGQHWASQLLKKLNQAIVTSPQVIVPTLTDSQRALAQRYYDACFTLFSCLQTATNTSAEVKMRVEESLFSPS